MEEITARLLLDRLEALEREVAELKARPSLHYCGIWQPGTFARGALVTHSGAMWLALRETEGRPGDGGESGWKLTAKSANGAHTPPAPRSPTMPRSWRNGR